MYKITYHEYHTPELKHRICFIAVRDPSGRARKFIDLPKTKVPLERKFWRFLGAA